MALEEAAGTTYLGLPGNMIVAFWCPKHWHEEMGGGDRGTCQYWASALTSLPGKLEVTSWDLLGYVKNLYGFPHDIISCFWQK